SQQEAGKGVPSRVQKTGKVRLARAESEVSGIVERFVIIEVAAVLIAEAEAVLPFYPREVVSVDVASVRTVIHEADAHAPDPSPLVFRGAVAVKTEGREHRAGQVLQPNLLRQVFVHGDRKSTRLNSSHQIISYAVFCLQ